MQPQPRWKSTGFPRKHISRVVDSRWKTMSANSYQTNSFVIFTWGPITFLVNRYNQRFISIWNLFPCPDWPQEFVNSDVNTSPRCLKKSGESLLDPTFLWLFQKPLEITTIAFGFRGPVIPISCSRFPLLSTTEAFIFFYISVFTNAHDHSLDSF